MPSMNFEQWINSTSLTIMFRPYITGPVITHTPKPAEEVTMDTVIEYARRRFQERREGDLVHLTKGLAHIVVQLDERGGLVLAQRYRKGEYLDSTKETQRLNNWVGGTWPLTAL